MILYAGELVSEDFELQEIAATTDGLLPSLISFFLNKPNEDDELIDERDIVLYNNLCKVRSANSNKL